MTIARLRWITLAVIAAGTAVSVGILAHVVSWRTIEASEAPEAVKSLLVLTSPYFGLTAIALLLSRRTLASAVVVLVGTSLTTVVGLALLFRLLIRIDAEGFLFLLLAVSTQWYGVLMTAGSAGVCLLIQRLVDRRKTQTHPPARARARSVDRAAR